MSDSSSGQDSHSRCTETLTTFVPEAVVVETAKYNVLISKQLIKELEAA
jgi:hypothetical protein